MSAEGLVMPATEYGEVVTKEKGSKFLGYLYRAATPQQAEAAVEEVRQKHPKATHHCYAYRLGDGEAQHRANDDGEPRGTAGLPIYNQLLSHRVTHAVLIVVRYYGGTKLGVGGLIKAYKENAAATLLAAELVPVVPQFSFTLSTEAAHQHLAYTLLQKFGAVVTAEGLGEKVNFRGSLPLSEKEKFSAAVAENHRLNWKDED